MPDLAAAFAVLLWVIEAIALTYIAYRLLLGLLSLRPIKGLPRGPGEARFLVLVPAHNEEQVIGETVESVLALDYPRDMFSLFVVADRCEDKTEEEARAAGAGVLVKTEPSNGKGSVIEWGLAHPIVAEAAWDAVVMFDADSRPAPHFLRVVEASLARGDRAVQGRIESHGQASWVATAHAMNTSQRNRTWHQAREAAGFSVALTGTGVCLTRELLARFPFKTRTLTEDLEYFARLTLAGVRVRYLYEAFTIVDQPPSLKASVGQRLRWARGQFLNAFAYSPALLWRSVRRLEPSSFDTALYLLLPSVVPLQAFLLVSDALHLLGGSLWPRGEAAGLPNIPQGVLILVLGVSILLPLIALQVEHRRYLFRDWVAFMLLMLTWLPIAIFAAMTTWVGTWNRTPRGARKGSTPRLLGPLEAETTTLQDRTSGLD